MLDLLSKEYYCYKIYVSWMENSALPFLLASLLIWITVPFLQANLDLPYMSFQKSQPPINKRGSHYGIYVALTMSSTNIIFKGVF